MKLPNGSNRLHFKTVRGRECASDEDCFCISVCACVYACIALHYQCVWLRPCKISRCRTDTPDPISIRPRLINRRLIIPVYPKKGNHRCFGRRYAGLHHGKGQLGGMGAPTVSSSVDVQSPESIVWLAGLHLILNLTGVKHGTCASGAQLVPSDGTSKHKLNIRNNEVKNITFMISVVRSPVTNSSSLYIPMHYGSRLPEPVGNIASRSNMIRHKKCLFGSVWTRLTSQIKKELLL